MDQEILNQPLLEHIKINYDEKREHTLSAGRQWLTYGSRTKYIIGTIAVIIFAALGSILIISLSKAHEISYQLPESIINECGDTPEEAKRNGCEFDVILYRWMPLQCFDGELMDEYLEKGQFPFAKDPSLLDLVPLDIVRQGQEPVLYTTLEFHKQHCLYDWMKLSRAYDAGRPQDSETGTIEHTKHCTYALFPTELWREPNVTTVGLEYLTCLYP
jgi:hypothetical protein